jgi:opacity protein-like surface antigen
MKLIITFTLILMTALIGHSQAKPCDSTLPSTKHDLGVSYNFLRRDTTFQSATNPNFHFDRNSDSHGLKVYGDHYFGKCNGGPLAFTVEFQGNRGSGRRFYYGGMGVTLKGFRNTRANPFIKATAGASRQNDVLRNVPGGGIGFSFAGTGFAFQVGAGLDVRVSKHVSLRLLELNYLRSDIGKGNDIHRNNFSGGFGVLAHW